MASCNSRKSLLSVFIYDILREYTDRDHHLTQESIRRILEDKDQLQVERKAVSHNINALLDEDFNIFGNSREGYWYDRWGYFAV